MHALREVEEEGLFRLGGKVGHTPDAPGLLCDEQLAAIGLSGPDADRLGEGDARKQVDGMGFEQLRIVGVAKRGVGFSDEFSFNI